MHPNTKVISDELACACGKKKSFLTQEDADYYIEARPDMHFVGSHICPASTGVWHVTTHIKGAPSRFKYLEKELHTEMANNSKTIRQRITDYMWDSYHRNKTTEFSSSMVVFAVQQEYPHAKKPNIMQEISKAKKDGIIVSLKKPVPDQRGAVYFTLSRILEEETEPTVTEVKPEVPKQSKAVPTNPFDSVHKKLDEIYTQIDSLSKIIPGGFLSVEEKLRLKEQTEYALIRGEVVSALKSDTNPVTIAINELKSSHVTVDGDKLADVINARFQNLKLNDSFIVKLDEQTDSVIDRRLGEYTDIILDRLDKLTDSDDYKRGIKDGIRLAVEMGIKLGE
jgi:hypothetical protein